MMLTCAELTPVVFIGLRLEYCCAGLHCKLYRYFQKWFSIIVTRDITYVGSVLDLIILFTIYLLANQERILLDICTVLQVFFGLKL